MTNRDIIIFGSGLIVGAGSGILATMHYFKKKYSDIADQQITEMEEYYQKTDEYSRNNLGYDDAEINPVEDRSQGVLSESAREEIKEKLLKNHIETTNYAAIYKSKEDNGTTERVNPEVKMEEDFDYELEDDPEGELNEAEIATINHQRNKDKPPKIISVDEYENLPPEIDTQTLYFYDLDETLVDDNDEEIEDPSRLIGDALTKYDFIDSDEKTIFVFNPALDTAYEIQRVEQMAFYNE